MTDEVAKGYAALNAIFADLLGAHDPSRIRQLLARDPRLLDPIQDGFLTRRIAEAWVQRSLPAVGYYLAVRAFMQVARQDGVDVALSCFQLPLAEQSPLIRLGRLRRAPDLQPRRIELLSETLELVRRQDEPDLWAALQRDLADALAQIRGRDRSDRLHAAIEHYQLALEVWDQPPFAHTPRWADTQHNLGCAWMELRVGDLEAQAQRAIGYFERAIEVRTPGTQPVQWAQTTRELAVALVMFPGREYAAAQNRAIKILQEVIEARPATDDQQWPVEQARSQVALGNAFMYRLEGGRTLNLDQARYAYLQALPLLPRDSFPNDWARIQYDCALTYLWDPAGDRAKQLRLAEQHLREALEIYAPDTHLVDWIQAKTALGNVLYRAGILGQSAARIAEAIEHFQDALRYCRQSEYPAHWATLQNNLANALAEQGYTSPEQQDRALRHYWAALKGRPRRQTPVRWATTMNNLGVTYAERLRGIPLLNQRRAVRCLRAALRIHTPQAFPTEARRAAHNLGQILIDTRRWAEAGDALATAIAAGDELYRMAISSSGREAELAEGRGLYAERAYALLRANRLADAVTCLEAGRARAMAERLALRERMVAGADAAIRAIWTKAQDDVYRLEAELRAERSRPLPLIVADLEQARVLLPALEETLSFESIGALVSSEHALAYCVSTPRGTYALVVFRDQSGVAQVTCTDRARFYLDPGTIEAAADWHADNPLMTGPLAALGAALIGPLARLLSDHKIGSVTLIPCGHLGMLPLHAAPYSDEVRYLIDDTQVAYAPSARALATARKSASRPRDACSLVGVGNPPSIADDGSPMKSLDGARYELYTLVRLLNHEPASETSAPLTAAAASRAKPADIPREASLIHMACHDASRPEEPRDSRLIGDVASRAKLLDALPKATLIHMACHGTFRPEEPLDSCLFLAEKDTLTLRDLLMSRVRSLDKARLVVLSACKSAVIESSRLPDEVVGLPAGFLEADVPAVIGTLWSVADPSTALLMAHFYQLLIQENRPPAIALRAAQRWLRDLPKQQIQDTLADPETRRRMPPRLFQDLRLFIDRSSCPDQPFADPYYWAPFTFQGASEVL